jgi:restriction endonuclease
MHNSRISSMLFWQWLIYLKGSPVIVVALRSFSRRPSVAIREGVLQSIQDMREHFRELYNNVPFDHFVYDSKRVEQLRGYAVSNTLQIMVINIDSFNKKANNIIHDFRDNPNVFQICTLNESTSTLKKRQEIGRGLRLPVNQSGERVFDDYVNNLVVVANESYQGC